MTLLVGVRGVSQCQVKRDNLRNRGILHKTPLKVVNFANFALQLHSTPFGMQTNKIFAWQEKRFPNTIRLS